MTAHDQPQQPTFSDRVQAETYRPRLTVDQHRDYCYWLADQGWDPTACEGESFNCPIAALLERERYLEQLFRGIASFSRCDAHAQITEDALERVIAPRCRDCLANDLREMAAGNVEATTMAQRLRECSARALSLVIENHRLRASATTEAGEGAG